MASRLCAQQSELLKTANALSELLFQLVCFMQVQLDEVERLT